MALFALFFLISVGIAIGMGIVFALVGLLLLAGLIMMGAVSGALLVGFQKRSAHKGFKVFIVLLFSLVGMIVGGVLFLFVSTVQHWFNGGIAFLMGAVTGLVAGFFMGLTVCYIIRSGLRRMHSIARTDQPSEGT